MELVMQRKIIEENFTRVCQLIVIYHRQLFHKHPLVSATAVTDKTAVNSRISATAFYRTTTLTSAEIRSR